ncbi:phosphoesterase [Gordoniibacillus kamchatkensis]|uniref:Putative phosphoesterase SD70_05370 n=1 Tax=Gordoniibacillus kamchatkensis TaxID=1590651 RepID=A0ABR5ALN4_9BACL|nr:2'-5' RNA ligase family protein [Paenibacillus sp. VKM B-2647]KIL41783.1 phosphoesterase [Paenibacillus sp. VKM B-2647]
MQFGIAVFPSKEVQDIANSFRKRYDPHYSLIQPHLTIREKDEWTDEQLERAVALLEQAAQTTAPFTIHFNRFSSFYPVANVVYMALSDTKPMQRLYEAICTGGLEEPKRTYLFNPHLTIGQAMNSDELHDVLASVKSKKLDLTSRIDRFHLLYQTDNGAWTAHQTFLLRG